MKKSLTICWKDLAIIFQDRAAWILMLAAPFLLTLGLGAVTGAFSQSNSNGLQEIPVLVVNQDKGTLGKYIVEALDSEQPGDLFKTDQTEDLVAARRQVESDEIAAAVLIPPGFSDSILPAQDSGETGPLAPVEVYANPARPVSASVVQSVVSEIVSRIESGPVSGFVTIQQLLNSGRLDPQDIRAYANEFASRLSNQAEQVSSITIQLSNGAQAVNEDQPNFLAYLAPGMAVFFLMYTVSQGGRSLLEEREHGTLARMLTTPTHNAEVLAGKILSVFAAGVLQVGVLILASGLMFGLSWGDPLAVLILILAVVAAATGWGILLASFARTPFQVSSIGSALMLLFGILGGTFIPVSEFSSVMQLASRITPNAWSMSGFAVLVSGGTLTDIAGPIGALLAMALLLFGLAALVARRRWASGFLKG